MKENKKSNIIKYHGASNINIGLFIVLFLLIYISVFIYQYLTEKNTVRYEVLKGNLVTTNRYNGFIIRDEKIINSPGNGYINFFIGESERAAVGNLIYILDQSGSLNDYLTNHQELTLDNHTEVLDEVENISKNFAHNFTPEQFLNIYDYKHELLQTAKMFENVNLLNAVKGYEKSSAKGSLSYAYSSDTGVVVFWNDGYEDITIEEINPQIFDKFKYQKDYIYTNTYHEAGSPAYKLITSEIWKVIFPIEKELGEYLVEEEYVKVKFLKTQRETWGKTVLHELESGYYLELQFNNSMKSFASDRFIDLELVIGDEYGLKIPNSSIANKDFFLIPEEYIHHVEAENKYYVSEEYIYQDEASSERHTSFITKEVSVYSFDEETGKYYVDSDVLNRNDVLLLADSNSKHVVNEVARLTGVYNVNKGFADFKEIKVLFSNDEYSIVKPDSVYGLRAHDYIALDVSSVTNDQLIVH